MKMNHLRQYIRGVLLTEGMKTVNDLPEDAYVWIGDRGSMFNVIIDQPSSSFNSQRLMWSNLKGSGIRNQWMPGETSMVSPIFGVSPNT